MNPEKKSLKMIQLGAFVYLGGFFCWLIYNSFLFSQSYDVLLLFNEDELSFHRTLQRMSDLIHQGRWGDFLAVADYGYGNIYWLGIYLSSALIKIFSPLSFVIAWPRLVSVMAFVFCLQAFYKICRYLGYSYENTLIAMCLVASCSVFADVIPRFHNHGIVAALILWALYFLWHQKMFPAVLLIAVALGIKITALIALPLFFVIWLETRRLQDFWRPIIGIFILALIFFSPTVLFVPFGFNMFYDSVSTLKYLLFVEPFLPGHPIDSPFWQNLSEEFFVRSYSVFLFFFGMGSATYLLVQRYLQSSDIKTVDRSVPWLVVLVSSTILCLNLSTMDKDNAIVRYSMSFLFIFTLIFLHQVSTFSPAKSRYVLLSLLFLNILMNGPNLIGDLLRNHKRFYTEENLSALVRGEGYKKLTLTPAGERVVLDHDLYFPLGLIKNHEDIEVAFTNEMAEEDHDVYIFSKVGDSFKKSCAELEERKIYSRDECLKVKNMISARPPWKKVFEDPFLSVIRRQKRTLTKTKRFSRALRPLRPSRDRY